MSLKHEDEATLPHRFALALCLENLNSIIEASEFFHRWYVKNCIVFSNSEALIEASFKSLTCSEI